MIERLYHLIAVNCKSGNAVMLTRYPMNHKSCMVMKSKFTSHACRTIQLKETK